MPELIAKSALEGQEPLHLGAVTLAEAVVGPITSVAVFPGAAKAVAKGMKGLGLTFPAPNTFVDKKGVRLIWTGRDQAFLIGVEPPALEGAAVTDVLARLVPLDMRLPAFPVGRAVRSGLNHMNAVILRTGDYAFEVMVFRSMARTAWHEIEAVMQAVAARQALKP